tara:strand:- start:73 stop:363 length:291 start_codon:yes stop_codon:yes gene_type:complete
MTGYAWVITRDRIDGGMENGTVGSWKAALSAAEIRSSEGGERFSMYDDDGNCCYEGIFVGDDDATGFEPLKDFGIPNAGCTEIRYRNPNTGKMERL